MLLNLSRVYFSFSKAEAKLEVYIHFVSHWVDLGTEK